MIDYGGLVYDETKEESVDELEEYLTSACAGGVPEILSIDYNLVRGLPYSIIKHKVHKILGLTLLSRKPILNITNCDQPKIGFNKIFASQNGVIIRFDCILKSVSTTYDSEYSTITYKCRKCGEPLEPFEVEHGCVDLPAGFSCPNCKNHRTEELQKIPEQTIYIDCKYMRLDSLDNNFSIMAKFYRGLDDNLRPGNRVTITGCMDFIYTSKTSDKLLKYILVLGVENKDSDSLILQTTNEDIGKMKYVSTQPDFLRNMIDSIFPYIVSMDGVKLALLLSSIGGVSNENNRGDSHTILIGDPGVGKSELVSSMLKVLVRSGRASGGSSTSGAGLTCACIKSAYSDGFDLIFGLLPLCNGGHVFIDEIARLKPEDRDAFHESLESGVISVHKGGFDTTLECHTTIFACANPLGNKFSQDDNPWQLTGIEPSLLSRFDHRIAIYNEMTRQKNLEVGRICRERRNGTVNTKYDTEFIRKYIAYARTMNVTCDSYIIDYLSDSLYSMGVETNRDAVGMQRIAESYARLYLRNKVSDLDAVKTVLLVRYERDPITITRETKSLSIDGNNVYTMKEYVKLLLIKGVTSLDDIVKSLEELQEMDVVDINALLFEMVQEGIISLTDKEVRLL